MLGVWVRSWVGTSRPDTPGPEIVAASLADCDRLRLSPSERNGRSHVRLKPTGMLAAGASGSDNTALAGCCGLGTPIASPTKRDTSRPVLGCPWSLENAEIRRLCAGINPSAIRISSSQKQLRNRTPFPVVVSVVSGIAAAKVQGVPSSGDVRGPKREVLSSLQDRGSYRTIFGRTLRGKRCVVDSNRSPGQDRRTT